MPAIRKVVLLINPSRRYTRGLLGGIAKYARLSGLWTVLQVFAVILDIAVSTP